MAWTNWYIPLGMLWLVWLGAVMLCAIQARKFERRLRQADRTGYAEFRPRAVVFVPFKGIDAEATANLHGLLKLNYPDYQLVLIVESEDDPAYAFLQAECAKVTNVPVAIVVAGEAPDDTGQKVHNLLAGISHVEALRTQEGDVLDDSDVAWVFADSDAVPGPEWLGHLVGPLGRRDRIAATTGYRWFVPLRGPTTHFLRAAQWASGINAGIATFASHRWFRFAWGGSMALLRSTAIEGGLVHRWRGALSDDYQATRMCRAIDRARRARPEHGQPPPQRGELAYLPECLVESPVNFTLAQLHEFSIRQYRITRVHAQRLFWGAFLGTCWYVLAWATAWVSLGMGVVSGRPELSAVALLLLVLVAGFQQSRAAARRRTIRMLFGNGTYDRLLAVHRWDRWAPGVLVAVNCVLMLGAVWGRTICWRGKTYRMQGPQDIRRIA